MFIIDVLFILIVMAFVFVAVGVIFYIVIKMVKENEPQTGERTMIAKDDRVAIIYQIRKDDTDFSANEIEKQMQNCLSKQYPEKIFRMGDFKIVDYVREGSVANIYYSVLSTDAKTQKQIEYSVVLQMITAGADEIKKYTRCCVHCGAEIADINDENCPYCGHTYDFEKYNHWEIQEVKQL